MVLIRTWCKEGPARKGRAETSLCLTEIFLVVWACGIHHGRVLSQLLSFLSHTPKVSMCVTFPSCIGRNCCVFHKLLYSPRPVFIVFPSGPLWLSRPTSACTTPPHTAIKLRLSVCLAPIEAESWLRCNTECLFIKSLILPTMSQILKAFGKCRMIERRGTRRHDRAMSISS